MNNFQHGENCNCDNCELDKQQSQPTTKTPRTDAFCVENSSIIKVDEGQQKTIDFARTLELENLELRKEVKDWIFNANELQKQVNNSEPERAKLKAQLTQLKAAGEELARRLDITDGHLLHTVGITTARHENKEAFTNWQKLMDSIK